MNSSIKVIVTNPPNKEHADELIDDINKALKVLYESGWLKWKKCLKVGGY